MPACARDCLFEATAAIAASAADITFLRSIMKSLALRFNSASIAQRAGRYRSTSRYGIAFSSEVGTGSRKENASEEATAAAR